MAALIIVEILVALGFGVAIGAFLTISFAIVWEDRRRSLRFDAPSYSTRTARSLVGIRRL